MRNKQALVFLLSLSVWYYALNMSDEALFGITSSCSLNSSACVSCFSMARILIGKVSFDILNLKKDYQGHLCPLKAHGRKVTLPFSHGSPTVPCLIHWALMAFPYCSILAHSSVNSIFFHERSSVNSHLGCNSTLKAKPEQKHVLLILGPSFNPAAIFVYCSLCCFFYSLLFNFPNTGVCQWLWTKQFKKKKFYCKPMRHIPLYSHTEYWNVKWCTSGRHLWYSGLFAMIINIRKGILHWVRMVSR